MNLNPNHSHPHPEPDCAQLEALLPSYAMGITDPDESLLVERLLVDCPEYQQELDVYKDLSESLLYAVPQVIPPDSLAAKLQQRIAAAEKAEPSQTPPPDTSSPAAPVVIEHTIARPNFGASRWIVGGAAAVVIAALVLIGYLVTEINNLRESQSALESQLREQEQVLNALGSHDLIQFTLASNEGDPSDLAEGRIICNPDAQFGLLRVENFAALDPTMAYQVWLIQGENRTSAGLFTVSSDGEGVLTFESPLPMGEYDYVGVTAEPAAGSDGPTSQPVVFGRLYPDA